MEDFGLKEKYQKYLDTYQHHPYYGQNCDVDIYERGFNIVEKHSPYTFDEFCKFIKDSNYKMQWDVEWCVTIETTFGEVYG